MTVADAAIGIIVLAAGAGRRFGSDKRRAALPDGTTLLDATLASIPDTFVHRLLVLRPEDEDLAARYRKQWDICLADNPQAGMANSLASGIAQASTWDGALIALGDMPYLQPATFTALQNALATAEIVVPVVEGKQGNPVGFRRAFFEEIRQLSGDRGARSVLERHADKCRFVETGDQGIFRDVDRPEALGLKTT